MPFSSDEPQTWLEERRTEALARFAARVPALYANPVPLPAAVARWAAAGWNTPGSLFIAGSIGVGKTHTAWTAAATWLEACFAGHYRSNPVITVHRSTALFDALRPDGDNPRAVAKAAQEADLLFIDDLAAARVSPTGWTQEKLYEIFDERYTKRRPTLITCDVLPGDVGPAVGPRVASRLAEMCAGRVEFIKGHDRRKRAAR